jgi:hypothetical protein
MCLFIIKLSSETMMTTDANGELVDKITILRFARSQFTEAKALASAWRELSLSEKLLETIQSDPLGNLVTELPRVNEALWEAEDLLRDHDVCQGFGD